MNESPEPPQARKHQTGVDALLALPPAERYRALAVGWGGSGHIADEVVVTVARRAHRERWTDERRYSQHLVQRVYRHVRGHVAKNVGWQKRGGGFDATVDDCAAFVLEKLAAEKDDICHAENAFGDYVYKRSLDFADQLFAKKRLAGESLSDEAEAESDGNDADSSAHASVLDGLLAQELDAEDEAKLQRVRELAQEDGFLEEKERIAFTYHWLGGIQIDSTDETKVTVCKLMNRKEKSVRLYIGRAIAKIKERLS